jgi:hypothetical protein
VAFSIRPCSSGRAIAGRIVPETRGELPIRDNVVTGAFAGKLLSSFLYGFGVQDPMTFAMVAGVFVSIAGLASYLPGRGAQNLR